jgi:hypothetical protein
MARFSSACSNSRPGGRRPRHAFLIEVPPRPAHNSHLGPPPQVERTYCTATPGKETDSHLEIVNTAGKPPGRISEGEERRCRRCSRPPQRDYAAVHRLNLHFCRHQPQALAAAGLAVLTSGYPVNRPQSGNRSSDRLLNPWRLMRPIVIPRGVKLLRMWRVQRLAA